MFGHFIGEFSVDHGNPQAIADGKHPVDDLDKCIGCHGGLPEVAELTADVEPNPHTPHDGIVPCNECHFEHKPSVTYCNECHLFELVTP